VVEDLVRDRLFFFPSFYFLLVRAFIRRLSGVDSESGLVSVAVCIFCIPIVYCLVYGALVL
jgi:hypothetical protein